MDSQIPPTVDWLVQTKLYPPQVREDVIARPHLLSALEEAVSTHPLTLISAPAGSGKTTLLAALCQKHPDWPLAWLALDENDADPARFLHLLLAALQRPLPAFGINTAAALASFHNPAQDWLRVLSVLLNDLLALEDAMIPVALDDLHAIQEPLIFRMLDYLIEHLPPHVHLLIATRHDPPLARGEWLALLPGELLLVVPDEESLASRWLQIEGTAQAAAARWEGWRLPESARQQPQLRYTVIRLTPRRMDVVDDNRGWGFRETLEL